MRPYELPDLDCHYGALEPHLSGHVLHSLSWLDPASEARCVVRGAT